MSLQLEILSLIIKCYWQNNLLNEMSFELQHRNFIYYFTQKNNGNMNYKARHRFLTKTNMKPDCGSISKIKNAYRVDYSW